MDVHFFVHEGKQRALGADDGELEDIAVASVAGGGLAALAEPFPAFFLHRPIDDHDIPVVKEPGAIKGAALQQFLKHQHRDLGDQFRVHAAGVIGGVIGAGDGRLAGKTRVLGGLTAQDTQIASRFSGLALLIEAIAGAFAREKHGQDRPPEVSRRIAAHLLHARVGQAVEPLIEPGKGGPHRANQALGGQGLVNARQWFAARRFARWL